MPHSEAEDKLTMAHSLAHSGHFQLVTPSKNLPLTLYGKSITHMAIFFSQEVIGVSNCAKQKKVTFFTHSFRPVEHFN